MDGKQVCGRHTLEFKQEVLRLVQVLDKTGYEAVAKLPAPHQLMTLKPLPVDEDRAQYLKGRSEAEGRKKWRLPMIPVQVRLFLEKNTGDVLRYDRQSALNLLGRLGVDPATEFGEFYIEYQGVFVGPRPVAELLDIEGPAIPAIPDQTDHARDRYQLPEKFLALTSDESEGMYLYNKEDQAVYDFDLDEYK